MGKKPVVIASLSLVLVGGIAVWFGVMSQHRLRPEVIFDPGQSVGEASSKEGRAQSVVRRARPEQTEGLESRTPETPSLETPSPALALAGEAGPSLDAIDQEELAQLLQSEVHLGWMMRVEAVLGETLGHEEKDAIRRTHLLFLHRADALQTAYLSSDMTRQAYAAQLAELFKWHQAFYQTLLTDSAYEKLFEAKKHETNAAIDENLLSPPPDVEIHNPQTTIEEVYQAVPESKLQQLVSLRKARDVQTLIIHEQYSARQLSEEQALQALEYNYQQYMDQAKSLLTPEEFGLIFGRALDTTR
jgi:hypothetical protein